MTQTVEPNYNPLGRPDSISGLISIKNRVFWTFTEYVNQYTTRQAWYTSCRSGGPIEQVTELLENTSFPGSPSAFDRIDNFVPRSSGDKAEWTFYDAHTRTSTPNAKYFNKC